MQDSSMEPTLTAGSVVRFQPAVEAGRGDVIAFEYPFPYPGRPRRELVARVIGLAGDRLELGPGGVTVNGQRLSEPYAKNQDRMSRAQATVAPGAYFVLGDDRGNQRDSRWWGPLPVEKLLGVASPPR
jgi:signal peptidase I